MFTPAKLADREEHQHRLHALLRDSLHGRGHTMLVTGAVASGKTAMLTAVADQAAAIGAMLLETSCAPAERELPFGLMNRLLDSASEASAELDDCRRALERQHGRESGDCAIRAAAELAAALLRLTAARPVVITVDDVDHADDESAGVLLQLSRRTRHAPLLLVLSERVRPARDRLPLHAELAHQPHFRQLRLGLLTPSGTEGLLAEHLAPDAAQRLAPELYASTGGNPLLVRALVEDSTREPGTPEIRLVRSDGYSQAVLGCLHRHGPQTVAVARGLAVLGPSGRAQTLADLLGLHPRSVLDELTALRLSGLVDKWAYRDAAARDAVLDAVPPAELAALHRRAADLLHGATGAPVDVARHLIGADAEPAGWMTPTLRDAAGHALAGGDPRLARDCLELALRSSGDPSERAAIRIRLAGLIWRSAPAAVAEHLDALADDARAGRLEGPDVVLTIGYLAWLGRMDTAAGLVCELVGAGTVPVGALAAAARWLAMFSPPMRPRLEELRLLPDGPLTADGAAGTPDDAYLHAAHAVSTALATGSSAEAVLVLQRYHLNDATVQPLMFALCALIYAGRLDLAAAWCDRLVGECTARHAPAWQAMLTATRAEILLRRGELTQAVQQARTALGRLPVQNWGAGLAFPVGTLIEAYTGVGRPDDALGLLALPARELLQTLPGVRYLRARGRWRLATGRSHAALGDFMACGEFQERWGIDSSGLAAWRLDAAEAWLALGDADRGSSLGGRQLRRVRPGQDGLRAAVLGVLGRTGDPHSRLQALGEAVEILERDGDRVQLATALGELGRAYRELGNFHRGRTLIGKAWYVAKACGAEPLCDLLMPQHAEAELEAAAGDPAEAEGLTEAEMRVAVLAAHGHTNREISAKLFITISTVEQHLTRVYRKLNVKRRRDLPLSLAGSGGEPAGARLDVG
ncbi:LuxR family transcriptional regulator [Actinoplanes sp. NPDC049118]|uniref:helix-turn-helix transcriptional regulator n=1 Tax=Actinoplanes sp. NPDC049118 TaxID=3155769 RepID=UPI0033F15CAC